MFQNIDWPTLKSRALTVLQTVVIVATTLIGWLQVAPTPPAPSVSVQVVTPDGKATAVPTAVVTLEK